MIVWQAINAAVVLYAAIRVAVNVIWACHDRAKFNLVTVERCIDPVYWVAFFYSIFGLAVWTGWVKP